MVKEVNESPNTRGSQDPIHNQALKFYNKYHHV